jgi:hypothetical protein
LQFYKGRQLFIRVHNEASGVTAICAGNPNWPPFAIHSCNTAPTETGLPRLAAVTSQYLMQRILPSLLSAQQWQDDFNCAMTHEHAGDFREWWTLAYNKPPEFLTVWARLHFLDFDLAADFFKVNGATDMWYLAHNGMFDAAT